MSFIDTIVDEVQASDKLDAGRKQAVSEFLQMYRAVLEPLGEESVHEFFQALHVAGPEQAWDTLVARLGQDELLELLGHTEAELADAVDRRAAAVARFEALAEALGTATLRVVTRLLLALL